MIKFDFKGKLDNFYVDYIIVNNSEEIKRSKRGKMMMLVQELVI